MLDPIRWLLDTHGFVTRDECGPWSPALKWTYLIANAVFALSYFGMPAQIFALWMWRRRDMVYPWILLLFVGFIAFCGLTHVADVAVFWWPAYRLFTLNAVCGATISLATFCLLPCEIKFLRKVPTPKQWREAQAKLEATVSAHEKTLDTLTEANALLQNHVNHLEEMRKTGLWAREQKETLAELRNLLRNGGGA